METHKNKKGSSSSSEDKVLSESSAESTVPDSGESSSGKAQESSSAKPSESSSAKESSAADPTAAPPTEAPTEAPTSAPLPASGSMLISVRYDGMEAQSAAVQGIMDITNNGTPVSLKDLKIDFYLTKNGKSLVFECYHAAVNTANGSYQAINSVNGSFSDASGTDCDTLLTIGINDGMTLGTGDKLTINFTAHSSDWTPMSTTDDWSVKDPGNIIIRTSAGTICGNAPQ